MNRPAQGTKKKKSSAGRIGNLIAIIFLSVICLLALMFCVFLLLRIEMIKEDEEQLRSSVDKLHKIEEEGYITEAAALELIESERAEAEKETTAKILDWIKEQFREESTSVWMLRNLYSTFSDELVVGSGGNFYFFPRNDELKKAFVSPKEMSPDPDGRMRYLGADGKVPGSFGIDVSRFQGKIDWEKVRADGVRFAFIRAGARGSSEGKLIDDSQFETNITGALENGIDVGVYFYTQAINTEEAVEEAEYVLEAIDGYEVTLPVVIDFESADSEEARTNGISKEQNTDNVLAFCDRISEAGYQPMIYGNLKSFLMLLDMERLEHIKKWFAFYDNTQYFPYEYSYWQYSAAGRVDGIEGDVDLNICIEDLKSQ